LKKRWPARILRDNFNLGIIIGLFAPLLGIVGFYLWKFPSENFIDFIKFLGYQKRILTSAVTFSLLANAIFFTIYINARKDKTAKGIFIVTVIYAVFAIVLKLMY
jgi:hypothetical protein